MGRRSVELTLENQLKRRIESNSIVLGDTEVARYVKQERLERNIDPTRSY